MKALLTILLALTFASAEPETGKINPVESKFIFHYSQPVKDFEVLGEVEPGAVLNNTPKLLLRALINKADKKFPTYNGLILSDNMETAKVILLK